MDRPETPHYLVVTVGTTPTLLDFTINEHQPDGVLFLVSRETASTLDLLAFPLEGLLQARFVIADAEDWNEAYTAALAAVAKALEWSQGRPPRLTADLTGGTKIMTAGLALALSHSGRKVTWSYVGAVRGNRDPETGRVIAGLEYIRTLEDPTARFLVREREALKHAWNNWNFDACTQVLGDVLLKQLTSTERQLYVNYRQIAAAFGHWDRFQYQHALDRLELALTDATSAAEALRDDVLFKLLAKVNPELLEQLRALCQTSFPSLVLVQDLIANAQRRAASGRFDDALSRYRRAVVVAIKTGGPVESEARNTSAGNTSPLSEHLLSSSPAKTETVRVRTQELSSLLESDLNTGVLQSLFSRLDDGLLQGGYSPVTAEYYEQVESYLLGQYETYGFHPLRGWPRFP